MQQDHTEKANNKRNAHARTREPKKGEKWWQKSENRPLSQKNYFLKLKI